mgnify:CR=1 FL=1
MCTDKNIGIFQQSERVVVVGFFLVCVILSSRISSRLQEVSVQRPHFKKSPSSVQRPHFKRSPSSVHTSRGHRPASSVYTSRGQRPASSDHPVDPHQTSPSSSQKRSASSVQLSKKGHRPASSVHRPPGPLWTLNSASSVQLGPIPEISNSAT